MNRAYGFESDRGFDRLLPLLYRPDEKAMRCHYAITEHDQIAAVVGLFPIQWHIDKSTTLRVAGVGGVAVAPEHRGKGFMHELLMHVSREIREGGFHLSYLRGHRQRYRKYDWEMTGLDLCAEINRGNVKRSRTPGDEIVFEDFEGDPDTISRIHRLHHQCPLSCRHDPEAFALRLRNWFGQLRVARGRDRQVLGYVVLDENEAEAWEVVGADRVTTRRLIEALADTYRLNGGLKLNLSGTDPSLCRRIVGVAEDIVMSASGNWWILDWPTVVTALLSYQHKAYGLPEGRVVVGIHQEEKALELAVDKQGARCVWAGQPPQFTADASVVAGLLFGPAPAEMVATLPDCASVLRSWCPLPLMLPKLDRV